MEEARIAPDPQAAESFPGPAGQTPSDLAYWVALGSIFGLGSGSLWQLIRGFGDLKDAWNASPAELMAAGLPRSRADQVAAARQGRDPGEALSQVQAAGAQPVTWHDPVYPAQLREIPDPPPLLYVRGDPSPATFERSVAIVGTRRMSAYGLQATERIAGGLAAAGMCVVSGMATGIDTAAHRAALQGGGSTVSVWGTGLHEVFPASNRKLARQIAEMGAIVTEYPLTMRATAENFPRRNRIISGLSRGTIVVEAPLDSGALITARYALEQNREVMAVPGDVFSDGCQGTNRLLFRGQARAVSTAEEILEALGVDAPPTQLELPPTAAPTAEEEVLLAELDTTPTHIDVVTRKTSLPAHQVSAMLAIMEIKGLARHLGAGNYVAAQATLREQQGRV